MAELTEEILIDFVKSTKHPYKTTHEKLCYIVIKRIYDRVCKGYRFGSICIYDEEIIIDGNHRYIAYQLAGIEIEKRRYAKSDSDVAKLINDIKIDVKEDWDKNNPKTVKFCDDAFLKNFKIN